MSAQLFKRYVAGEFEQVYEELVLTQATDASARAIAQEMMRRVRHNVELLAERWRYHGFSLSLPYGKPGELRPTLDAIEERFGLLPIVLRAFYDEVGWINFAEASPGPPWPRNEELDPLYFEDISLIANDLLNVAEAELTLFGDNLVKYNISGVGAIYVPLPRHGFDTELFFEGNPLRLEDGRQLRLVPYLRQSILKRGGICIGSPLDEIDQELVQSLTDGLLPF